MDDYVVVPDSNSLDLTNNFTVQAWIKFDVGGTENPRIISKGWENQGGYELALGGTTSNRKVAFYGGPGDTLLLESNSTISSSVWNYIVVTYDGITMRLYLNGSQDASKSTTGALAITNYLLNIGRNSGNSTDKYKGLLDDIRIYNYARSPEQIQAGYNSAYYFFDKTADNLPAFGDPSLGIAIGKIMSPTNTYNHIFYTNGGGAASNIQDRLLQNNGSGIFTDVTGTNLPVDTNNEDNSATFGDIDNDGDLDLAAGVWNGRTRLYTNNGTGTFTEVTAANMPNKSEYGYDVEFADFDNDGDLDLYVANEWQQDSLYLNNGSGVFSDGTAAKLPVEADSLRTQEVVIANFDGISGTDIFTASVAGQDHLYLNNGSGVFTDATANLPADSSTDTGADAADVDGDGDIDIVIASNGGTNRLYLNNGSSIFTDATATKLSGANFQSRETVFLDVDGDGDLDIFFLYAGSGPFAYPGKLFVNDGTGTFTDQTTKLMPAGSYDEPINVKAADFNGDGKKDLFITQGAGSATDKQNILLMQPIRPVAHWKFDEGTGVIANDVSGNNNHGTLYGATWSGGALSFDGVDDYVGVIQSSSLLITGAVTVQSWIKLSANTPGEGDIVSSHSGNESGQTYGIELDVGDNNKVLFYPADGSISFNGVTSLSPINLNQWYFLAAVNDPSGLRKIYINGTEVVSATGVNFKSSSTGFNIGKNLGGGQYFNGLIDDVKIYNYARTAGEIQAAYNASPVPAVDDYVWVTSLSTNNVTRIKKSDSSTTTITVGTTTGGIAVDSNYVWVENTTTNNVTRIKKSDLTTTTIAVGTDPCGIAVDETYSWVANYGSNNVTRINKYDLTKTTISAGTNPTGVAIDGTYVWVSNQNSNNVTRIKKSDLTTATIAVGATPSGIAVDETYVWVANQGSTTVTRIKKSDSSTTNITVGSQPVGVSADETYCWVANAGSANVTRIKKSDSSTIAIAVGNYPNGVSVDGTYCWVANEGAGSGNTVTRILKSDLTTTTITVGTQPNSMGDMTGWAYDNYAK
ncbi:MAG: LamG-like jellyroll fold domain-containing protein [Planctomycetota bacterium]